MKPKYEQPENMATALDCAIREYEKEKGGFEIGNTKYLNYMCNKVWDEYLKNMNLKHKRQYGMGAGGELKAGQYPPQDGIIWVIK